jgi:hypothetical protein
VTSIDTTASRHLIIRLDPRRLRRWHVDLVARLASRPATQVGIEWAVTAEPLPPAFALLFALERSIYRIPVAAVAPADPIDFAPWIGAEGARRDLVIDLCGSRPLPGERTWQVTFDGAPGETAARAALGQSRVPVVAVIDAHTGDEIAGGRPGTESSGILVLAFADVLARTATLIAAALDGAATRAPVVARRSARPSAAGIARLAVRSLASRIALRLSRPYDHSPHWRVGWRFVNGPDLIDLRAHPPDGWRVLPDDRLRFYADPFPFVKGGRTYLFVEEFEYRLGRGVISAVEFGDAGPIGTPCPVLQTGWHLSYPFIFEHRGETWMVPESCATATIDLYRAASFPDCWVKTATLVSGMVASDATLIEHAGRWWMFAVVRDGGGSYSDTLHLWSARDLFGPWTPHRRNPVLIDSATARPAGRIVERGGKLVRPVQDCRDRYGAALGLAEILCLNDERFEQRLDVVLRPGALWPGCRLHTLNRAGRLECIDGAARLRRF